uniref:extracellular solute-binding protein n=4 Tax=Pseudomonas syringae TaxID=317 RepID=UPI000517A3F6
MNQSSLVNTKFLASHKVLMLGVFALMFGANIASAANRSLEGQTIVLYTSGGTQLEVTKELVIEPFEKETGAKVVIDDGCCTKLQAAMQSGQFLGDVIVGEDSTQLLNQSNLGWFIHDPRVQKIAADHGVPAEFQSDSYLVTQRYSYVIAAKNKEIPLPTTWKDFWDVKKFPGSRGLIRLGPMVQLEGALLADGVAADKIYPIGVFQGSCRVNRLTMLLFSQRFALDPGLTARCR